MVYDLRAELRRSGPDLFAPFIPELAGIEDEYEAIDLIDEYIYDKGRMVFSYLWDSGGPGAGAGAATVYEVHGMYVMGADDVGLIGPFDSVDEALKSFFDGGARSIGVNGATTHISCETWTDEELIRRLDFWPDADQGSIEINGRAWRLTALAEEHRRLVGDKP